MAAVGAPIASDTFLALFGTPTLLWRVLHSVGYAEPPRYFWSEVVTEGQQWYDVRVTVATCVDNYLHQNLEEESQGLESSQDHVIKESIACRSEPTDLNAELELAFFG